MSLHFCAGTDVGPDHPFKIRLWTWLRRWQAYRPLTIRYGRSGWLTVDERCFIQRNILVDGDYEPEVLATLLRCGGAHEVVWDIGANIGAFAVSARQHPAVTHIVCFEPDPENRGALRRNLQLNRGCEYVISSDAVSDVVGRRKLRAGPATNRGMSSLAVTTDNVTDKSWIVQCVTVDALVFERKTPAPTLLKIDAEGWDYHVLVGARKLLRAAPPKAIVFETRCDPSGRICDTAIVDLLHETGTPSLKFRDLAAASMRMKTSSRAADTLTINGIRSTALRFCRHTMSRRCALHR